MERAARVARYQAFADVLGPEEVLFVAQHRDDQAETLLFRLLRGAGVRGLGAMPASRRLGQGSLVRPLLTIGRDELEAYARTRQLQWIEDPSNASLAHARNYLRHEVLPVIRQRWAQAPQNIARAAAHLAEAQTLLDELAVMDLEVALRGGEQWAWLPLPSLALPALRSLTAPRQRNALRHWLARYTLLPDTDHWAGWEALRDAGADASPCWRLDGGELHRGVDRLWWISGDWLEGDMADLEWSPQYDIQHLPGNGSVGLARRPEGVLEIRYRRGGETMRLPGRGQRDLKRLLNEAGVPGFVRSRLPLLYRDGELIAVANLPRLDVEQVSLVWTPPA